MMTCANCGAALTLADPGRRVVSSTDGLERMTVDELGRETWMAEEVETSVARVVLRMRVLRHGPSREGDTR